MAQSKLVMCYQTADEYSHHDYDVQSMTSIVSLISKFSRGIFPSAPEQLTYSSLHCPVYNTHENFATVRTFQPLVFMLTCFRIIEWFGLERTFKDHLLQSSLQPDLEHFRRWGIHNFSGKPVPASHHPHCKKISSLHPIQIYTFLV